MCVKAVNRVNFHFMWPFKPEEPEQVGASGGTDVGKSAHLDSSEFHYQMFQGYYCIRAEMNRQMCVH